MVYVKKNGVLKGWIWLLVDTDAHPVSTECSGDNESTVDRIINSRNRLVGMVKTR